MKRFYILLILAGIIPMSLVAQDDLYFTPKKSVQAANEATSHEDTPAYYSGISKDESEYNRCNRLKSYYQKVGQDSLGNDIIEFRTGDGTYGDAIRQDTIYPGSEQYVFNSDDDFAIVVGWDDLIISMVGIILYTIVTGGHGDILIFMILGIMVLLGVTAGAGMADFMIHGSMVAGVGLIAVGIMVVGLM